jgi:hypothetical protein
MKITEKEFNVQTGEETISERNETAGEKNFREKFTAEITQLEVEAEAKAAQRQVVLEKLGLTVEEAQLLLS